MILDTMDKVINLSRGKPNKSQLDLSNDIFNVLDIKDIEKLDIDYRNYGLLSGIEECKELFGDILGVNKDNVVIYGNSSLNIMYDLISKSNFLKLNGYVLFQDMIDTLQLLNILE